MKLSDLFVYEDEVLDLRRSHESEQLTSLDDAIDVGEDGLGLLRLTVLDCDCDALPAKAPDVGVGELGVVAPDHLLDVRHLAVSSAIRSRSVAVLGQVDWGCKCTGLGGEKKRN